jgi:hypothetical protein
VTEPWLDHALEPAAQEWIVTELAAAGRRIGPGTDQPRIRPWSTVLRIATDDGSVWFKANGPGTTYEPWLMSALADWAPGRVLEPLATDPDRGWSLLPDGGTILRSLPDDEVLVRWERILPEYAQFQQGMVGRVDDMVRHGVPDDRPAHMPGRLAGLLGDPEVLLVGQPAGLTHDQLRDLHALEDRYVGWCARLDAADIPPSIEHGDLHDGNVFVTSSGHAIFDWGDACVTHPFAGLLVALNAIAYRFHLEPGAAELVRLRDAYLEPWADGGGQTDLAEVLRLATRVHKVGRAVSWNRALSSVPPAERGEYGDAVPGWLLELFEPDLV